MDNKPRVRLTMNSIARLVRHLEIIHNNLWEMEIRTLDLGMADSLRSQMNNIKNIKDGFMEVLNHPELYP